MAQLAAIGIVTRDLSAATRFYRALGVDVPEPSEGEDHFEATLPNGLRLMWDAESMMKQLQPDWRRAEGGPAIVLAFECASPAEVDQAYQRVADAGFDGKKEPFDAFWGQRYATVVDAGFDGKKEPFDAFWGQRYATVVDPDGNAVDLFAAL